MLPSERYAKIKRDAQVQEKMIEVRYERMRPYAEAAGIPLKRTQLWGELVGGPNKAGAGFPEGGTRWAIEEEDIRKHFYGKVAAVNKRQAYTRAIEGLTDKGEIAKNEGFFWLVRSKHKI